MVRVDTGTGMGARWVREIQKRTGTGLRTGMGRRKGSEKRVSE